METCLIASPDKLSISMFCDFFQSIVDRSVKIEDMSCLISQPMQEAMFQGFLDTNKNDVNYLLIKYKTKPNTILKIPIKIEAAIDYIIKFDIFSTHPELLKDRTGQGKEIVERWIASVAKME